MKSTRSSTSSAHAPSTTATRSSSATAHWAATACSSSGRPSSSASSFDRSPKRVPAPAARINPQITATSRDHQAGTSWIRPLRSASRPPSRPCRAATISAMIDSAVSSRAIAPRSRPTGADSRSSSSSDRSHRDQPLASLGLRPARPHRARRTAPASAAPAAAPRRRAWGRGSAPRSTWPDRSRPDEPWPPRARRRSPRPRRETATEWRTAPADRSRTGAIRRPVPRSTATPRCRPPRTRSDAAHGPTTSTNNPSRRSEVSAHSSSPAIRAASSSSSGEPSEPERAPSASTSSFGPGRGALQHRHLGRPAAGACDLLEPAGLVRLHPHVDLAAARQPDVPRVRVRDPEVQQLRRIPAKNPVGDLGHRALDAPTGHRAGDLATRQLTAIFAPGGRGAERCTSITVASAIRSPRSFHNAKFRQDVLHRFRSPQG